MSALSPSVVEKIRIKLWPCKCKETSVLARIVASAWAKQQTSVKGQPHFLYVLWEARHSVETFRFHPWERRIECLSQFFRAFLGFYSWKNASFVYLSALSLECTCPPPWDAWRCEPWLAWWGHSWTLFLSCAGPAGSHWEPVWSTVCVHSVHSLKEQDKERERERLRGTDNTAISAGSGQQFVKVSQSLW